VEDQKLFKRIKIAK